MTEVEGIVEFLSKCDVKTWAHWSTDKKWVVIAPSRGPMAILLGPEQAALPVDDPGDTRGPFIVRTTARLVSQSRQGQHISVYDPRRLSLLFGACSAFFSSTKNRHPWVSTFHRRAGPGRVPGEGVPFVGIKAISGGVVFYGMIAPMVHCYDLDKVGHWGTGPDIKRVQVGKKGPSWFANGRPGWVRVETLREACEMATDRKGVIDVLETDGLGYGRIVEYSWDGKRASRLK